MLLKEGGLDQGREEVQALQKLPRMWSLRNEGGLKDRWEGTCRIRGGALKSVLKGR